MSGMIHYLSRKILRKCSASNVIVRHQSSSFIANAMKDSFKEALTEKSIENIINGKLRSDFLDTNLVESQGNFGYDDFYYDIDMKIKSSGLIHETIAAGVCDPFQPIKSELSMLNDGCKALLDTDNVALRKASQYFFEVDGGKKIRPAMVLLMSRACNNHSNPKPSAIQLASQRRLAEIVEMIHTASLFHDDVIDKADTRRGRPSANKVFGNKMAILAGDFLLARASVYLARLRSLEAVELLSTVIEHLVKGEILQMRSHVEGESNKAFEYYAHKTYYKTGSLMANSCRAAALLGGSSLTIQKTAHTYGKRIGLAFQIIDDVLDFEGSQKSLGKPALNDLKEGLATAPVLLAAEEHPELLELIARKFREAGDVDAALYYVQQSNGISRAKDLAYVQAELAIEAVMSLQSSRERDSLVSLATRIVDRTR